MITPVCYSITEHSGALMKAGRYTHIDILQIVRLFAACMVILYHSDQIGYCGFFGVEIFFVVSGFLAFYTTAAPVSPCRYLLKRSIRLFPLYWIFTIITFIILTVWPGISNMSDEDPLHFLFSLLFIPYIGKTGATVPILAVGWTLYYEVAFSLLFSLALLVSHRHRFLVSSLLLLGLTAAGQILRPSQVFLQFYTSAWYFDFFLGLLAGVIFHRLRSSVAPDCTLLSARSASFRIVTCLILSLLALVSLLFLFLVPASFLPGIHEAFRFGVPAFVLVLSLVLLMDRVSLSQRLLMLGNMTYSVYLVEYFSTSVYKRLLPESTTLPWVVFSLVVLILITFIISWIPWQLIEIKLTSFLSRKLLPTQYPGKES